MAKRSRWADEAALQALVRFGPQESVLTELQRQAQDNYDSAVQTAHGTAAGTVAAIDKVTPGIDELYGQAGLDQAKTGDTLIGHDLAGLGSVADSIKAGSALEVAAQLGNLQKARTSALTDLGSRRVAAKEGETFATQNAHNQLVSDIAKVLRSKQDLAGQKGAFEASTSMSLEDAAAKEAQTYELGQARLSQSERNSVRSSGIDPDTGKPIKGGRLDPAKAKPRLSADKHFETAQQVSEIATYAERYKGKLSRAEIVAKLQKGRPQVTVRKDPDTGKDLANPVPIPKIPAFKADLRMTAALDIALDGHLSRKTEQLLGKAGFKVSELGLPTYGQWRREWDRRHGTGAPSRAQAQRGARSLLPGGSPSVSVR